MSTQAIPGPRICFVASGVDTHRRPGPGGARLWLAIGLLACVVLLLGLTAGVRVVPVGQDAAAVGVSVGERSSVRAVNATPIGVSALTVRVQPGETLWDIAARTFPQEDPRAAVVAFRDANGGQLPVLHAGDQLIVPSDV